MHCPPRTTVLALIILLTTVGCGSDSTVVDRPATHRNDHWTVQPQAGRATLTLCDSRRLSTGVRSIPLAVWRDGQDVAPIVSVCIGNRGPFPFLLDTGGAATLLSPQLVKVLGLRPRGPGLRYGSEGCRGIATRIDVPSISIGGIRISLGRAYSVEGLDLSGGRSPQGTIGADILSKFSAIRLDFVHGAVTFAAQGTQIGSHGRFSMRPAESYAGFPQISARLITHRSPRGVSSRILISLASDDPRPWIPDTGSRESAIDARVAHRAGLKSSETVRYQPSLCSHSKIPVRRVNSGPWTIAGVHMAPQLLVTTPLLSTVGAAGVLGANTMSKFGTVVFDWSHGRLSLGGGR